MHSMALWGDDTSDARGGWKEKEAGQGEEEGEKGEASVAL